MLQTFPKTYRGIGSMNGGSRAPYPITLCPGLHNISYRAWRGRADKTLGAKVLALKVQIPGERSETRELPLGKLSASQDEVLALVGRYYGRAMAAKEHHAATLASS